MRNKMFTLATDPLCAFSNAPYLGTAMKFASKRLRCNQPPLFFLNSSFCYEIYWLAFSLVGNYQDSLSDAKAAIKLQPNFLKAIIRGNISSRKRSGPFLFLRGRVNNFAGFCKSSFLPYGRRGGPMVSVADSWSSDQGSRPGLVDSRLYLPYQPTYRRFLPIPPPREPAHIHN